MSRLALAAALLAVTGFAAAEDWPAWRGPRGDGTVELTMPEPRKMEVIRRLAAAGPAVQDLEITPPTLDDLYAHFLREGDR